MSSKAGRPPSGNTRQNKVEARMTADELRKLDDCCRALGRPRSEVIRKGIELIYEKIQKLNKDTF